MNGGRVPVVRGRPVDGAPSPGPSSAGPGGPRAVSAAGWCGVRGRAPPTGGPRPSAGPPPERGPLAYALLWENSFSTGTPTLCRALDAQSRWKNSST